VDTDANPTVTEQEEVSDERITAIQSEIQEGRQNIENIEAFVQAHGDRQVAKAFQTVVHGVDVIDHLQDLIGVAFLPPARWSVVGGRACAFRFPRCLSEKKKWR
jgi:hypothetical protein